MPALAAAHVPGENQSLPPTPGWWVLVAAVMVAAAFVIDRRSRLAHLATLRAEWGRCPDRVRDLDAISAYHRGRNLDTTPFALDDRTWDDLDLDDVFAVLDRTESVVGQQMLYVRLRSGDSSGDRDAFEALVTRFGADAPARERAQLALSRLRNPAGDDLWWLTREGARPVGEQQAAGVVEVEVAHRHDVDDAGPNPPPRAPATIGGPSYPRIARALSSSRSPMPVSTSTRPAASRPAGS